MSIPLTGAPIDSAFWGQSFVAELKRISAHGERKLKMRKESVLASPSPGEDKAREEFTEPANNTEADGPARVSGAHEAPDNLSDGVPGDGSNAIQDNLPDGYDAAVTGIVSEE